MAKNIDKNNVGNLTDSEISRMSAKELNEVLAVLKEIRKTEKKYSEDQQRVYTTTRETLDALKKTNKELDETDKKLNKVGETTKKINKGINSFTDTLESVNGIVENGFLKPLKELGKYWGQADQAANDFGKHIGLSSKGVAQLRDQTIKFANDVHIGIKYNASISEMIQLQESYAKSVGRNVQLTNNQKEALLATQKVMGENTVEFVKKLENLGIGMEKSGDLVTKMFKEASKNGISFQKYSESVTQNLTKVQSYGFRKGVEGLTDMAKKAAEVNLNISEAFKVADKIQTGGVQEAIKMGANLQVLGGPFAGMGNPMSLLYEGLNDVESLQDRMINMFGGFGRIENGQVKFSGADRLRMQAGAQAMGISSDEMFQMASRQAVRSEIESQMGGRFNGDEELKELVLNTATLDKNNNAIVNINGQPKALKDVTAADKEYLKDMQKTQADDIKDIAQILRGYNDVQTGFTKEIENKKASAFSEIGKATKGLYGWAGKNNTLLTIIKDSVLALTLAQAMGAISGGFGNLFGASRGGVAGGGGIAGAGGTAVPAAASPAAARAARVDAAKVLKQEGYTARKVNGETKWFRPDRNMAKGGADASSVLESEKAAGKIATSEASGAKAAAGGAGKMGKFAKFASSGAGKAVGGAALGGAIAGIGYLADGSFTSGNRAEVNKAILGTAGATIGGLAAAIPVVGPILSIALSEGLKIGGEALSKAITAGQDRRRSRAREAAIKEYGEGSARADAIKNLKGDYTAGEIEKIKEALKDKKIDESELSARIFKKMAKSGDTELLEAFGSESAKKRLEEKIADRQEKMQKGEFSMETGQFQIANAEVSYGSTGTGLPKMAEGGIVIGPSHAEGGVPVELEGGETVVPKSGKLEGFAGSPTDNIRIEPINLNISGTINLNANGQQYDMTELINSPAFRTQIAQLIERSLSDNTNGGNFKETRKNKYHNI